MFGRFKDVALLLGRIGVAVVFLAHGLQKWNNGIDGTAKFFSMTGIPLPTVAAVFAIAVEILGSIAFIVGFLLPLVGIGYVVISVGALLSVHIDNGLTGQGGYELSLCSRSPGSPSASTAAGSRWTTCCGAASGPAATPTSASSRTPDPSP